MLVVSNVMVMCVWRWMGVGRMVSVSLSCGSVRSRFLKLKKIL